MGSWAEMTTTLLSPLCELAMARAGLLLLIARLVPRFAAFRCPPLFLRFKWLPPLMDVPSQTAGASRGRRAAAMPSSSRPISTTVSMTTRAAAILNGRTMCPSSPAL